MDHLTLMKPLIPLLFTFLLFSSCSNQTNELAQKFSTLPETVEDPWCYYYWVNDDISKEGITKDLLAMKAAGIGTAFLGNVNHTGEDGRVPLFSEEWWECMVHLVNEGKRIGIDIGIFNCPGWSQSGGPWITGDKAMRFITWSETNVAGPGNISITLPRPDSLFQDLKVLAFPAGTPEKDRTAAKNVRIKTTPSLPSSTKLADGDPSTGILLPPEVKKCIAELDFPEKIRANSLLLYPETPIRANARLYARLNGRDSLIRTFLFDRSNFQKTVGPMVDDPLALALPGVQSSKFTLVLENIAGSVQPAGLSEIVVSEQALLEKFVEKQLGKMHPTPLPEWNSYSWEEQPFPVPPELTVQEKEIQDISAEMQENGRLDWEVPEGNWTILRMGMTPTGVENHPAAPQGVGFEVDKMNEAKVRYHFDQFAGELLKRIPEENREALKYLISDSYEVGSQNWTDGYRETFMEKYGYDPIPYLPVLTGRIVGSVTESERFLWDLRRAVADDIAHEYVGGLKTICNENNMQLWLENYGHWGFASEFLMYGGQSDLVGGEFWNEGSLGNIECKAASSAAHIYGKPVVYAEAFTSSAQAFLRHPALLKKRGDWSFTEGINHYVLCLFIHQPDDTRKPGVNAWYGTEINRHNTWFSQASSWTDYIRRCQLLLQQGSYAADVCYFIGEDAPIMTGSQIPELPGGYAFDFINAEVILNRLSVKDGKLTLPGGMSYHLMVLPQLKTMRPEVLAKIEELVKNGGKILGPPPEHSPSLEGYPACDEKVREMAARLWIPDRNQQAYTRPYGQGMVFDGMDLPQALQRLSLEKDVEMGKEIPVLWTHRTLPGKEVYFLTNQQNRKIRLAPSFRVSGLKPQLWDPVSGEIRRLNEFNDAGGRTTVPLQLNPLQSCFVVFSNQSGRHIAPGFENNFPEMKTLKTLHKEWQVEFHNKSIGPENPITMNSLKDWRFSSNPEVKYYSGGATYQTTFNIDEIPGDREVYLNLGNVEVMAEVRLNGKETGGVWIAPYRLNISRYLKAGENTLEVDVVNLWRNRMVRDKSLPEAERYTWTYVDDVKAGEELQPSGLLGPVTLEYPE